MKHGFYAKYYFSIRSPNGLSTKFSDCDRILLLCDNVFWRRSSWRSSTTDWFWRETLNVFYFPLVAVSTPKHSRTRYSVARSVCEVRLPCKSAICYGWPHSYGPGKLLWHYTWSLLLNLVNCVFWIVATFPRWFLCFIFNFNLPTLANVKGCIVFVSHRTRTEINH
jgi:hypothetical protein